MNVRKPPSIFFLTYLPLAFQSDEFSSRLLEERNVAVVPGHAFGAEGYVRLSYATSDVIIEKGMERLASFCSSL